MNARAFVRAAVVAALACAAPAFAQLSVPSYSSLPGAPATLYLNFVGDYTASFGPYSNFTTPAYDIDDNPFAFSATELSNMGHIWSGVAEKYSPFNINVTTVDPGTRNDGLVAVVDVGGDGAWLPPNSRGGGISSINGFTQGFGTGYVFPRNLGVGRDVNNNIIVSSRHTLYVAEASAHEAGHLFGLRHQSTYDPTTFAKLEEYKSNGGTDLQHLTDRAPTLGLSYYATRGQWWVGPTVSTAVIQNDMNKIAQMGQFTNNFGFRPDDHPDTYTAADPANLTGIALAAQGIIGNTADVDYIKFTTPGGVATIYGDVNLDNPMLDFTMSILDANGNILQTSAHTAGLSRDSLKEFLQLTLDPGQYELAISSANINPGDVGQYFITGEVAPEPGVLGLLAVGVVAMTRRGRKSITARSVTI